MIVKLDCPHAVYREGMQIFCAHANDWCGHVYFKRCKGWWVLSDGAARCPLRRSKNGQDQTTTADGNHAV